jgi:hypothetical protein
MAGVRLRLQGEANSGCLFQSDTPRDIPYKPYDPDAVRPTQQIFVENQDGRPQELGQQSRAVAQLREQYELVRYYFPAWLRDDVARIADQTLWRK